MNQNQQRRVQTMQLYYNTAKKYKTPTPKDTGGDLQYDIRELRLRPEKLTNWYQEEERESAKAKESNKESHHRENTDNATQEWHNYKNKLGEALTRIYPISKKQTHRAEPECVTKLEHWGTEHEIRQLDHA